MSFDDLWNKYGDGDIEPEKQKTAGRNVPPPASDRNTFPEHSFDSVVSNVDKGAPIRYKDTPRYKGDNHDDSTNKSEIGVIGNDDDFQLPRGRNRRNNNINFGNIRYWPWVDIIGILITIIGIIMIVVNFQSITDTLFYWMLPFLSGFVSFIVVVIGIIIIIWLIFRRPRGPRW